MNVLIILIIPVIFTLGLFVGGAVIGYNTSQARKKGHRPTAYGCEFWTGDRSPLGMGTCPVCGPPKRKEAREK